MDDMKIGKIRRMTEKGKAIPDGPHSKRKE